MTRTLLVALTGLLVFGPVAAQTPPEPLLSERIASGTSFVVVTKDRSVPLRAGNWSYPDGGDRWTV